MFNEDCAGVCGALLAKNIHKTKNTSYLRNVRICNNQTLENILKREQASHFVLSAKETGVDIRIIARSTSDEQSQSDDSKDRKQRFANCFGVLFTGVA